MEISVIVTNYNYGRFLGRCIRSLLNQSIDPDLFEIIVVDDCSSDDSREILGTFRPQIKEIFLETNLGLAGASNAGMMKAQGRYVVRVDSDDYVHPDFLRVILLGFDFFGRSCEGIALDYLSVSPEGETVNYGSSELDPIACGIAFKLDAIKQLGYYKSSLRLHEEVDLRKRFLDEGFSMKYVNLPLYRYVRHESSLTRRSLI
jgi:glycosyltransferase involved in cell wall biosynthesis